MDCDNKGKEVTVQGRDTPVPVRGLSGRAGSPGPSACDRSAIPVGTQAGSGYKDTGKMGSSLALASKMGTPGVRGRINSLPEIDKDGAIAQALGSLGKKRKERGSLSEGEPRGINLSYTSLIWDENEKRSVKRPKESEDKDRSRRSSLTGVGKMRDRVVTLLRKADGELRTMREVVRANKNTKVELKDGVDTLSSLISQLNTREVYEALEGIEQVQEVFMIDEQEGPTRVELADRLEHAEEEVRRLRKENDSLTKEIEKLRDQKGQVMEHMFHNKTSYEDFMSLERMDWPNKVFKSAFLAEGSPLAAKTNTDHVVTYQEGKHQKSSEGLRKTYEDRYPELKEMEEEVGAIKVSTRVVNRDGTEQVNERWVIRAEAGDDDSTWFNSLLRVRNMLQEGGRVKAAFYPPGFDTKGTKTRKMLEFIFRDTNIKCILYVKMVSEEGTKKDGDARPRMRRSEALVVSQEGKTYSELLKVIKDKIKPHSTAAKAVKTIREARDRNRMVIVLDKEEGAAIDELKGEIRKMEFMKITDNTRKDEQTVYIQDIDYLSSREEVIEALCSETGLENGKVLASELRRGFGGNWVTTVRLPREKAAEICRKGKIRIGLNWCTIKERVDVFRCFRCWKYGHLAKECKQERDDSKLCRKCGGIGYVAAECTHTYWCLTCKVEGHITGTGACPEFRKALSRERKARRKKRGY